jgi:hypothetical protein
MIRRGIDERPIPPPRVIALPSKSTAAYLYLLRVPLMTAVVFAALPIAGLASDLRGLLRGLFDVQGIAVWGASTAAFMLALTIMTTAFLVLAYAEQRMAAVSLDIIYPVRQRWYATASLLALPTLIAIRLVSGGSFVVFLMWCAAGLITSIVLYLVAMRLVSLLDGLHPLVAAARWLCQRPEIGAGYVDLADGSFLPGHRLAASLMILSAALYVLIGDPDTIAAPTLVYALLLLVVLCWGLAGVAFFLDRYRVPVLLPLAVLVVVTGSSGGSDHYFRLLPMTESPVTESVLPLTPGRALGAVAPGAAARRSAIVVAVNGGGIQAAAWTARVLTGLERECRRVFPEHCQFGQAVRLVSAVSGGAVGAMFVIESYRNGALPDTEQLEAVAARATRSSLRHVGWGLLYRDLLRPLFPHFDYEDRGSVLEDAWQREVRLDAPLRSWGVDAAQGLRPAVIFNATISETGERLLIGNANPLEALGRRNFQRLYPRSDLSVVTAARLSAAFPYVSPAARADNDESGGPHIVDGGYYDVYGIASLVDWLDEALQENQRNPAPLPVNHVFVLQVRGAPPEPAAPTKRRGWFYQAYAPLATLLGVRGTGQLAHNEQELALLRRAWEGRVAISSAVFQFCGGSPPLSWHMTRDQVQAIDVQWQDELRHTSTRAVMDFLAASAAADPAPGPPASVSIPARCAPAPAPQQDPR